MVAAMKGMTITARTIAAVNNPVPNGGPANRSCSTGTPSKVSMNVGSTYCDISGTMMKKPHMP